VADDIRRQLEEYGFRTVYESTAVAILSHPERPGLDVRVGTSYVVANRNGKELYRSQRRAFDLRDCLRKLGFRDLPSPA
jgi:hypothetical protein